MSDTAKLDVQTDTVKDLSIQNGSKNLNTITLEEMGEMRIMVGQEEDHTRYLRDGNNFKVAPKGSLQVYEALPPGQYMVKENMFGFYLERMEDFTIPSKLYGRAPSDCNRILQTFLERKNSTGVLLDGQKGGGKTMLARAVSVKAAQDYNIPTLLITEPFSGDDFSNFIQSITQPAVILFDEFEKVYSSDHQERLLSLLDGVYTTKKLFILTSNYSDKLNENMLNRPGRLYYKMQYKGVDAEFVEDYCNDVLHNQDYKPQIHLIRNLFTSFSFDMLQALVEETNRYGEQPLSLIEILNTKPDTKEEGYFYFRGAWIGNFNIPSDSWSNTYVEINLFKDKFHVAFEFELTDRADRPRNYHADTEAHEDDKWDFGKIFEGLKTGALAVKAPVEERTAEMKANAFVVPEALQTALNSAKKATKIEKIEAEISQLRNSHQARHRKNYMYIGTYFSINDIQSIDKSIIRFRNADGVTLDLKMPFDSIKGAKEDAIL